MNTESIKIAYEIFSGLLIEDRLYLISGLDCARMCKWIGVPEKELDSYIYSELGYSGDELIQELRRGETARLHKKYADLVKRLEESKKAQ